MERVAVVSNAIPEASSSRRRGGFTLVELLAVIMIIALLAGLVTPAVLRARNSARNAAIKAEIDMLHMAIMNYKNEYGSFFPCNDVNPSAAGSVSAKHVQRLFPRCVAAAQLASATKPITPEMAIVSWLTGYRNDPQNPLINPATPGVQATDRKKLFDFDQTRLSGSTYRPAGKKGSPYIYIDSSSYLISGGPPTVPTWSLTGGTYYPHRLPNASGAMNDVSQQAFNADTFQILCAGQDEEFGTEDDLSNFWKGTRKEYLDSLK
jgi:prepilin-type N-terminal cleavage/methylation domain-containing protein